MPTTVQILKSMTPNTLKPLAKIGYRILKDPSNTQRHINTYLCEKNMYRTEKINYTPPVLGIMITEQCNLRCPSCLFLLKNIS